MTRFSNSGGTAEQELLDAICDQVETELSFILAGR